MQELDAHRRLTPRGTGGGEERIHDPGRVAVGAAEEPFAAERSQEPARGGIGVHRHRRDGGVDLERARPAAPIDEPVDAGKEQLFRLAGAEPKRFVLEGREMREEQLGLLGPAIEDFARDLHQRRDHEPGRPAQARQLLPRQRHGGQHERDGVAPPEEASLASFAQRFLRERLAPGTGHCRDPFVRRGGGSGEIEEVHAQVHGA